MPKVTRFQDLICWQKARGLVNAIYALSRDSKLERDWALRNQLVRAALSAMTNIAEGFARRHVREFIRFLDIAQSSAVEVQSLLVVVRDQHLAEEEDVEDAESLAVETERLVRGLFRYLSRDGDEPGAAREPSGSYHDVSWPPHLPEDTLTQKGI